MEDMRMAEAQRADLERVAEMRRQLPRLEERAYCCEVTLERTANKFLDELKAHRSLLARLRTSRELLSLEGRRSQALPEEEG